MSQEPTEITQCKRCNKSFGRTINTKTTFCGPCQPLAYAKDKNCDHLDHKIIDKPTKQNDNFTTLKCNTCNKKFGITHNQTQTQLE